MLHDVMPEGCPPPSGDGWLWLACFDVVFPDTAERTEVQSIDDLNNAIEQRLELLSTSALQEMLFWLATNASAAGLVGVGPRISGLRLGSDGSALLVDIALYVDPETGNPTPLAEGSASVDNFRLTHFENSWNPVTLSDFGWDSSVGQFRIGYDVNLEAGTIYRLTVISPPDMPIVDTEMRPLLPLTFAVNFQLNDEGNGLVLNTTT
jgi:hypothetical protein